MENLKEGCVGVVVWMGNSREELLFTVLLAVANAVPVTSCPPEGATVVQVFPAGSSSSSVTHSSVGFPHLDTELRATRTKGWVLRRIERAQAAGGSLLDQLLKALTNILSV